MSDCMTFPDTLDEFLEQYQFKGEKEVYTNGSMLIPAFRVRQWAEHLPTVGYVPMDFHERCLQVEIQKRMDLERFAKWVMDEIFSENWEGNRIAFDELACRKLVKLGYVAVDEENDLYYRKDEPEDG